jgi:hypothetical protein
MKPILEKGTDKNLQVVIPSPGFTGARNPSSIETSEGFLVASPACRQAGSSE